MRTFRSGAKITYTLTDAPAIVTMAVQTNTFDNGAGEWVDIGGENVQALKGFRLVCSVKEATK